MLSCYVAQLEVNSPTLDEVIEGARRREAARMSRVRALVAAMVSHLNRQATL